MKIAQKPYGSMTYIKISGSRVVARDDMDPVVPGKSEGCDPVSRDLDTKL